MPYISDIIFERLAPAQDEAHNFVRDNKYRILSAIIISVICCLIINVFHLLAVSSPEFAANEYIGCLKNRDYKKAADYYNNIPTGMVKGEDIGLILKNMYDDSKDFKITNINNASPGKYDVEFETYRGGFKDSSHFTLVDTKDSLLGLKKDWKVIFPFNVKDLCITGTDGFSVFIDNTKYGEISGGVLNVKGIICGRHDFRVEIKNTGESSNINAEITEGIDELEIKAVPESGFRKQMEKLITDFCTNWAKYSLSEDPQGLKPYLTDRLYNEYAKDTNMFYGSKYITCEFTPDFRDIIFNSGEDIFFNVDEKWHLKENITDSKLLFKDNGKTMLEQYQNISWEYHIIKDQGQWKVDNARQVSFIRDILN